MKFQSDLFDTTITAYGEGWIMVGRERIAHNVILDSNGNYRPWSCPDFDALTEGHFAELAQAEPEVILFGSGSAIRFPRPAWLRPLTAARIGMETMDTQAACRTYNILASEGRRVIAALLL
ncbi:MAG: Mth938-like domain-containing protein [Ottowia sp.]|nr:Mth938-like domain-containing protein [Ottowia sp.]